MTAVLIAALKATASQWRLLLLIAAVAASVWLLHAFGKIEYQRGRTEVQQKWDAASASQAAAVSAQKASDATQAAQASIVYQKEIFADTASITDDIILNKGINADPGKGVITK